MASPAPATAKRDPTSRALWRPWLLGLGSTAAEDPSAEAVLSRPSSDEEQHEGVELAEDEESSLAGASALSGASRVALHANLQLPACLVPTCHFALELLCASRPIKEAEVGLRLEAV